MNNVHFFLPYICDGLLSLMYHRHHTRGMLDPCHALVSRALCLNARNQSKSYRQPECLNFSDRYVFSVIFWFEKCAVFKKEEARQNKYVLDQNKVK